METDHFSPQANHTDDKLLVRRKFSILVNTPQDVPLEKLKKF